MVVSLGAAIRAALGGRGWSFGVVWVGGWGSFGVVAGGEGVSFSLHWHFVGPYNRVHTSLHGYYMYWSFQISLKDSHSVIGLPYLTWDTPMPVSFPDGSFLCSCNNHTRWETSPLLLPIFRNC